MKRAEKPAETRAWRGGRRIFPGGGKKVGFGINGDLKVVSGAKQE